jgi:hypothetical protein
VLSGVNVGLNSSQGSGGGSGTSDTNGNYSAGVLAGTSSRPTCRARTPRPDTPPPRSDSMARPRSQ